jgi:acetyl esterase/lipase
MKRSALVRRTVRSARPLALALAVLYFARKWPEGKRRLQFIQAFRAGRKFYHAYPHIAKDIAYGDQPWQTLDVYWPPDADAARLPVILFAHGGSWSWGDKSMYPLVGARFTAQGCVVVIINYSHYPAVTFPAFVEDAAAAIAWTIQNVVDYHGDPNRLFIAGHSAGAHILSLVALDDRYLAARGLKRSVLRGLICISAPTDLREELRHLEKSQAASPNGLQAIMGGPDRLPLADPIRHARGDAPPTLIIHGEHDQLVPMAVARNFASALTAAGAHVDLMAYERADHYSILLDGVREKRHRPIRLLTDTIEFIQKVESGTRTNTDKH